MTHSSNLNSKRIFYACQAVLVKERQTTKTGGSDAPQTGEVVHGVQSIGVDFSQDRTTYEDFGRFQREYGSYGKPVYTITIDRLVSLEHIFTAAGGPFYRPAANPSSYPNSHPLHPSNLGADGVSNNQEGFRNFDITLLYGHEYNQYMGSAGDGSPNKMDEEKFPLDPAYENPPDDPQYPARYGAGGLPPNDDNNDSCSQMTYRCCRITGLSYSIPVQGYVTESITLETHTVTHNDGATVISSYPEIHSDPSKEPHIIRRHNLLTEDDTSVFPEQVHRAFDMGIRKEGNQGEVVPTTIPVLGLQSIEVALSINYLDSENPDIGEFGGARGDRAQQNTLKQVVLPMGVTVDFTGVAQDQFFGNLGKVADSSQGELKDTLFGTPDGSETHGATKYETDQEVNLQFKKVIRGVDKYFQIILGQKNYLTGISTTGGDTGGGNVETTLTFQNDHCDFITYGGTTIYDTATYDGPY
jgi:hypothetical protein